MNITEFDNKLEEYLIENYDIPINDTIFNVSIDNNLNSDNNKRDYEILQDLVDKNKDHDDINDNINYENWGCIFSQDLNKNQDLKEVSFNLIKESQRDPQFFIDIVNELKLTLNNDENQLITTLET